MTTEVQATIAQIRTAMVDNCNWGVEHHSQINYGENRPGPAGIPKLYLPFTADCSSYATLMAKWSGAGDPNGYGFDGYGNTDSMLAHSPHIARNATLPGDYAIFGLDPSTHCVVLVESAANGHDALVVSHGQQGDPIRVPLSVEAASHPGEPITFLQLQPGDPPLHNPDTPVAVDGGFGPLTTKALQWRLKVPETGAFDEPTKMALQRYLKVTADGTIGPTTVRTLQLYIGASPDGDWGSLTTEALQRSLNAQMF